MNSKRNFLIGLFVVSGVALLLVFLFAFGAADIFTPKVRMVTWYAESVQGLAKGSPVKYKGVPIGKVDDIAIQLDGKLIRVEMEVELTPIYIGKNVTKNALADDFRRFIDDERDKGLRCRLDYSGVTGSKYVEIDYFDRPGAPDTEPGGPVGHMIYIPSKASSLTDMLALVSTSLENISKIDFEGISTDLRNSARSLDQLLNSPTLHEMLKNLETVSVNLEQSTGVLAKTLTEDEIDAILAALKSAADGMTELAREIGVQLEDARLGDTTASFRDAMNAVSGVKETVEQALVRFDRTLGSFEELVNLLDQDPSAILRGKRSEPVDMDRLKR